MKIHKLGHCCLVVEVNGKRIMTDPGSYSTLQNEEKNIDIILFTHEHPDHLHMDSLKTVMKNNPQVKIITNTSVGKLLDIESISYEILEQGDSKTEQGVLFEGFGQTHEKIYKDFGLVQNTGYFIENKLFYPGDAFTNPNKPIDILALPIAGPWMEFSEAMEYCLTVKPRVTFPVHDGMLKFLGPVHRIPGNVLPENGIEFVPMLEGDSHEF